MTRRTERPAKRSVGDANRARKRARVLREWLTSLGVAVALFLFVRTCVAQTFVIISPSMAPTLLTGDMLVANRLAIGSPVPGTGLRIPGYSAPRRGDVLVFDPHHVEGMKLVKRLVGLPGDTLSMRAGILSVNGSALEEPYVSEASGVDAASPDFEWQRDYVTADVDRAVYAPTRRDWGPLVVPPGHLFMLGDNRDSSLDSRYWGPLAASRVEARVSFVYFSYHRESYRPFPAVREIRWSRVGRSAGALSGSR